MITNEKTIEILESLEDGIKDYQVALVLARLLLECDELPTNIYTKRDCAAFVNAYIEQHAGTVKQLSPLLCREIEAKTDI